MDVPKAKHCQIFTKNKSEKKIHEVSEKIWLSPPSIQIESDSPRCFYFTDTIWIVGPVGQAIRMFAILTCW